MPTKLTTRKPTKPTLPAALVKRATAAATAKTTRLLREAREQLSLIARRKREITEAFYDIGVALSELKKPEDGHPHSRPYAPSPRSARRTLGSPRRHPSASCASWRR